MVTKLNFNAEYNNYSGMAAVNGKLLTTPLLNVEKGTYFSTIQVPDFSVQITDEETGEVREYPMAAGNYQIGARGKQFNPEIHKAGATVSFSLNYQPELGVIFNLANMVSGAKPVFGTPKVVVVDNASVKAEELQNA